MFSWPDDDDWRCFEPTLERDLAKRIFDPVERYAIWSVHGEKCYTCGVHLEMINTMEVDHVIPEVLEGKPELAQILKEYGLPGTFDLQSFENLLPSCGPCNNRKRQTVFKPTLFVQGQLQKAAEGAPKVRALIDRKVVRRLLEKAIGTVSKAIAQGTLSEEEKAIFGEFFRLHEANRAPEMAGKPLSLAPGFQILSDRAGIQVVRGPYGVGGGPATDDLAPGMRCTTCGSKYFNGARCVICGQMDDD